MKTPTIQYVAAKALIGNSDGAVLVLKQSDLTITGGNKYHPPGGIVEPGESLKECVIREVREEIGVDVEVVRLVDVGEWCAERGDELKQFVGLFYECKISSNNFKLQSSEVSEIKWVGARDIDECDIVEPSKTIIRSFLEGAGHNERIL